MVSNNMEINYLNSNNEYESLYPYTIYSQIGSVPAYLKFYSGTYIGTGTYGAGNYTKVPLNKAWINGTASYLAIIRGIINYSICIIGRGGNEYYQTGISFVLENNEYKISYIRNDYIDTKTPRENIIIQSAISASFQMNVNGVQYYYKVFN